MSLIDFKSSHSEVDSFRRCQRAHFYSYGLKIQPANPGKQLVRGVLGHAALAEYYSTLQHGGTHRDGTWAAFKLLGEQLEELGDFYDKDALRAELAITLRDYFEWVEAESNDIEVIAVEREFSIEVTDTDGGPSFTLPFIVDLIVARLGRVEAWDHKWVWDFFNPRLVDLSPQLPLYKAGLEMLGYAGPDITVRYNELRYQTTKEIKLDKFARFNRAEPRITPIRVRQTVEEHIQTSRIVNKLKNLPIEEWESWVVRAANNTACKTCDMSKICIGELNGESRDLYIGVDYQPRKKRQR